MIEKISKIDLINFNKSGEEIDFIIIDKINEMIEKIEEIEERISNMEIIFTWFFKIAFPNK